MMNSKENPPCYVIGAGSMGTFLAARIHSVAPVTLVAREEKVSLWKNGIILTGTESAQVPVRCVSWPEIKKFPDHSLILLANKLTNLNEVLQWVAMRLSQQCVIVLCQNGLGVMDEAAKLLPSAKYLRAVCWLGVKLDGAPQVKVAGVDRVDVAGEFANSHVFVNLLQSAKIPAEFSSSMGLMEWRKALWNISINGLCAISNVPNGEVLKNPFLKSLMNHLLDEAMEVAKAEGVILTQQDRERVYSSTEKTKSNLNSTLQDLRAGRATEIDWLNGAILRLAEKHRIAVPYNHAIYHLVKSLGPGFM